MSKNVIALCALTLILFVAAPQLVLAHVTVGPKEVGIGKFQKTGSQIFPPGAQHPRL